VGNLSPGELAILLLIALLVFGGKGLPQAGQAIGRGLREFRRALSAAHGAVREAADPPAPPDSPAPRRLVE
jgi:sec-independent protein translocase protein TatA